jgi:hypothetical protein
MIYTQLARGAARVVVTSMLIFAAACTRPPVVREVRSPATQYVVAVDLSTSQDSTERDTHKALLHGLADELDFGDRLVLLKAHAAGVEDTSRVRTIRIPRLRGTKPLPKEKTARDFARRTANANVTALFKSEQVPGTDLLATLHTAGELAEDRNDSTRTVLVLLSDMLHCAQGVCMEPPSRHVPDSAWIEKRKQEERLPSIEQMCVVVVGADGFADGGPRIREFWRRYLSAAGANFDPRRYVHRASSADMLRCAG